jgi:hypothetical protein
MIQRVESCLEQITQPSLCQLSRTGYRAGTLDSHKGPNSFERCDTALEVATRMRCLVFETASPNFKRRIENSDHWFDREPSPDFQKKPRIKPFLGRTKQYPKCDNRGLML